jgi:hypothetical protein
VENQFIVPTSDVGSSWMFDWGEGNFSEWIYVGSNDSSISQYYSWNTYGVYNVRVKHRSTYLVESSWSDPLIVTVQIPSDLDGDGFENDLEISYGTNQTDENDFPRDTDGDGIPDYDSIDMAYKGDLDDDNDGIDDILENKIGLNPKIYDEITYISIEGDTYILANNDYDDEFEILFNMITESMSNIIVKNGKSYLDINGNKIYDYIYYKGSLSVYKETNEVSWILIVIAVICVILAIFFILFKKGILYFYIEK